MDPMPGLTLAPTDVARALTTWKVAREGLMEWAAKLAGMRNDRFSPEVLGDLERLQHTGIPEADLDAVQRRLTLLDVAARQSNAPTQQALPHTAHRTLNFFLAEAAARRRLRQSMRQIPQDGNPFCGAIDSALQSGTWSQDLDDLTKSLGQEPPQTRPVPTHPGTQCRIVLVVEDEPVWSHQLVPLVEQWLGRKPLLASSVQEAEDVLARTGRSPSTQTHLAIVDLGLPMRQGGDISRQAGLELLKRLRSYETNWHVLVLTAPGHLYSIQKAALELGLSVDDFLFKWPGRWEEEVQSALLRVISTHERVPRLELVEPGDDTPELGHTIRVDGVEIKIARPAFAALAALVPASRNRNPRMCARDVTSWVMAVYGEDLSPSRVREQLDKIQAAIHDGLNRVGRTLDFDVFHEEKFNRKRVYRLGCPASWARAGAARAPEAFSVLVVEDTQAWREDVAGLLAGSGYEVEAVGTLREALDSLQKRPFHAAVLDLQFPAGEAGDEPLDEAGVMFLDKVQESGQALSIVVLSALAEDDNLRHGALKRGVAPRDFLAKSETFWQDLLLRRLHRLENEYFMGVRIAEDSARSVHRIEIRTTPPNLRVDGVEVPLGQGRQLVRLLQVLAERQNHLVPSRRILEALYPGEDGPEGKQSPIKRLVNRLKNAITERLGNNFPVDDIVLSDNGDYGLWGRISVE